MNHSKHTLRDVVLINSEGARIALESDDEDVLGIGDTSGNPAAFAWKKSTPFRKQKARKLLLPSPWRASAASVSRNRVSAVTN
jgi:hypothetical protein